MKNPFTHIIKVVFVTTDTESAAGYYEAWFDGEPDITGDGSTPREAVTDLFNVWARLEAGDSE